MDDYDSLLETARAVAGRKISTSRGNPIKVDIKNGKARMFCEGKMFVFKACDLRGGNTQKYSTPKKTFCGEGFLSFLSRLQMPNLEVKELPRRRILSAWEIRAGRPPQM